MPLTLNVGLSKKIGLPNYGSLGVSCSVQVELDPVLILNDLDEFQRKVRQTYVACHQAVQSELERQQGDVTSSPHLAASNRNGQHRCASRSTRQPAEQARRATGSQVRAIEAIARRHRIDLEGILRERFGASSTSELAIDEASSLIDELKASANGSGGGR